MAGLPLLANVSQGTRNIIIAVQRCYRNHWSDRAGFDGLF
jgi:hypothetical protein